MVSSKWNAMKVEIIGSFLPYEALTEVRNEFRNGIIDANTLKHMEDLAVTEIVKQQLMLGLSEVTSGEIRRTHWDLDFWFGLNGISKARFDSGHVYQNVESGCDLLRINGQIGFNPAHSFFDDLRFLIELVGDRAVCMECIPSPSDLFLAILVLCNGDLHKVYHDKSSLLADIARAYNDSLEELYRLGCRRVQFDDTACGRLCQDNFTKRLLQGGIDLLALHADCIQLINESLKDLPNDLETSLYLSGGDIIIPEWEYIEYPDNIMPKILKETKIDKFYLPLDTTNDYQFEILRHVPAGKKVVLGLIDAFSPFDEDSKLIRHSISLAQRYISTDKLSVSPRTGFKLTDYQARGLTAQDQWSKLSKLKRLLQTL